MIEQEMKDYISNHSRKRTPNVDKLTGDALEKKYNKTLNLVRGIENKISYGLPAEINLLLALYKNNKLATDMWVIDVCNSLIEKAKQHIAWNEAFFAYRYYSLFSKDEQKKNIKIQLGKIDTAISNLTNSLDKLESKRKKLVDLYLNSDLSKAEYNNRLKVIYGEAIAIKTKINQYELDKDNLKKTIVR